MTHDDMNLKARNTHCLLSAALSFVCSQVHWVLDVEHWEQVGSFPSHFIFFRLDEIAVGKAQIGEI